MTYTILVPVFDASAVVARTLRYLLLTGVDAERIVVADDGSTDARMPELASWATSQGIRWERVEENLGYTCNVNRGLAFVETDQVLIMNSDCFISCQSLQKLADVLSSLDLLGCVGPLSSNAGHQTVLLKRDLRWDALSEREIQHFAASIERSLAEELGLRPWLMPSVNGFCCLWKMSALREINYFDCQEFPRGYGEEDDACLRLMATGRFPAIVPYVFAPHLGTQSFTTKERDALKSQARHKLRRKFSNAFVDRFVTHNRRNPQLAELKRVVIGG